MFFLLFSLSGLCYPAAPTPDGNFTATGAQLACMNLSDHESLPHSTLTYVVPCGITQIPTMDPEWAARVTKLVIENQEHFKALTRNQMVPYRRLKRLEIKFTLLETIEPDTFATISSRLKVLILSNNQLKTFPWFWLERPLRHPIRSLDITENPLVCWPALQWLSDPKMFYETIVIPDNDGNVMTSFTIRDVYELPYKRVLQEVSSKAVCRDEASGKSVHVRRMENIVARIPNIAISSRVSLVKMGDVLKVNCNASMVQMGDENNSISAATLQLRRLNSSGIREVIASKPYNSNKSSVSATFKNVQQQDMGILLCEVTGSQVGLPAVDFGLLLVRSPPKFYRISQHRFENGDTILWYTVSVIGYPRPNISLSYPSSGVEGGARFRHQPNIVDTFRLYTKLQLSPHLYIDSFTLTACNQMGCVHSEIAYPFSLKKLDIANNVTLTLEQPRDFTSHSTVAGLLILLFGTLFVVLAAAIYLRRQRRADTQKPTQEGSAVTRLCPGREQDALDNSELTYLHSDLTSQITSYSCLSRDLSPKDEAGNQNGPSMELGSHGTSGTFQSYVPWVKFSNEIPSIDAGTVTRWEEIGEGAFGKVYRGSWHTKDGKCVDVAMKSMKFFCSEYLASFEKEALVLSRLDHAHIVKFLGVCVNSNDVTLLFEFMNSGDLRSYLHTHGPNARLAGFQKPDFHLSTAQLLDIAHQISCGMIYLKEQNVVHRDIAARNCLVQSPMIVKVSDFGMSRDMYAGDYYKMKRDSALPLRWLAPESVTIGRFSPETDVWSFGVLLWEIFSYGVLPWCQYSNTEVLDVVRRGGQLKAPPNCPVELYLLISRCWSLDPTQRASIEEMHFALENLANKEKIESDKNKPGNDKCIYENLTTIEATEVN